MKPGNRTRPTIWKRESPVNSPSSIETNIKMILKAKWLILGLVIVTVISGVNSNPHELIDEELSRSDTGPGGEAEVTGRIDQNPSHQKDHKIKEKMPARKRSSQTLARPDLEDLYWELDSLRSNQVTCIALSSSALAVIIFAVVMRLMKAYRKSKSVNNDAERGLCRTGRCLSQIGLVGDKGCVDCQPLLRRVWDECMKCKSRAEGCKEETERSVRNRIDMYVQESLDRIEKNEEKKK